MAYKKNPSTSADVFCLTLPLRCPVWIRDYLDKVFQCCNNVKNALIADRLNALKQLERTKAWRNNQEAISESYEAEKSLRESLKKSKKRTPEESAEDKENKEKLKAIAAERKILFQNRKDMLNAYGFFQHAFEKAVTAPQHHYRKIVNSHVAQRIAVDVWKSFEAYLYGDGETIRFSNATEFFTISGKNNATGIVYENGCLKVNNKVKIPVVKSRKDPYNYETEALSRDVHYCIITRRPGPHGWQYFAQLVLAGKPPVKVIQSTGEVLHSLGKGRVGNDIGPQTLATVSDNTVTLGVLCESVQDIENEIRKVNRAMDRSRRATNPQMFSSTGEIVPINSLPDECVVTIRGKKRRRWNNSKRYKQLAQYRRYLYSKQAVQRLQSHHALANELLALGDEHYIEEMNWKALSKRAKTTELSEKTGKYKRKKRFGKSIANKAPGLFMKIYESKVKEAGGIFCRIDTAKAKASQYNHETKAYKKKHLSQRWNTMPDGSRIQRDLYSAFLIQNINETHDDFIQSMLDKKYEHVFEASRTSHISCP